MGALARGLSVLHFMLERKLAFRNLSVADTWWDLGSIVISALRFGRRPALRRRSPFAFSIMVGMT